MKIASGFNLVERAGMLYFTVPLPESAGAMAWFSTRHGGVSQPPYDTLNLGFHVGDDAGAVRENRTLYFNTLGLPSDSPVAGAQVHGDKVEVVDQTHRGRGSGSDEDTLPGVDGLLTRCRGLPLSSYYADCVPLYLVDPGNRAVGLVHAGWKGTVLRIGAKALHLMVGAFGTRPEECLAAVGPAVGPCCYQVDQEVISGLRAGFSDWRKLVQPSGSDRWQLDLPAANRQTLIDAGLKPENIIMAGLCTSCRTDLFFSYRAARGKTGRMASVIVLV